MKTCTIIGGVNGCGKSSFGGILQAERTDLGVIVDANRLIAQTGSEYRGGRLAVKRLEDALACGANFTWETTLSGGCARRLIRRAERAGYRVRLYYIGLDRLQECLRRIGDRVRRGGHDTPRRCVERRFARRFADLAEVLPCCDEALFFDNDNGFALVAEYRGGAIRPAGGPRPLWPEELSRALDGNPPGARPCEKRPRMV